MVQVFKSTQTPKTYQANYTSSWFTVPIAKKIPFSRGQVLSAGLGAVGLFDFIRSLKNSDSSAWNTIAKPILWTVGTIGGIVLLKSPKNLNEMEVLSNGIINIGENIKKTIESGTVFTDILKKDFADFIKTIGNKILAKASPAIRESREMPNTMELDDVHPSLVNLIQIANEENPEKTLLEFLRNPSNFQILYERYPDKVKSVLEILFSQAYKKEEDKNTYNLLNTELVSFINHILEPCGLSLNSIKYVADSQEGVFKYTLTSFDSIESKENGKKYKIGLTGSLDPYFLSREIPDFINKLSGIYNEEKLENLFQHGKEIPKDKLRFLNKKIARLIIHFFLGAQPYIFEIDEKGVLKKGSQKVTPFIDHLTLKAQNAFNDIYKEINSEEINISIDESDLSPDYEVPSKSSSNKPMAKRNDLNLNNYLKKVKSEELKEALSDLGFVFSDDDEQNLKVLKILLLRKVLDKRFKDKNDFEAEASILKEIKSLVNDETTWKQSRNCKLEKEGGRLKSIPLEYLSAELLVKLYGGDLNNIESIKKTKEKIKEHLNSLIPSQISGIESKIKVLLDELEERSKVK